MSQGIFTSKMGLCTICRARMRPRAQVNVDTFDAVPARPLVPHSRIYNVALVYEHARNARIPFTPHVAAIARHDSPITERDVDPRPHLRPVARANKKMERVALRVNLGRNKERVPHKRVVRARRGYVVRSETSNYSLKLSEKGEYAKELDDT